MAACKGEHCAKFKAKQKNTSKISLLNKASVPRERLYRDLSKLTVKTNELKIAQINHDNWKDLVCKMTGKKWPDLTVMKSDMVECTCEH